jgi:hypothetical protein
LLFQTRRRWRSRAWRWLACNRAPGITAAKMVVMGNYYAERGRLT